MADALRYAPYALNLSGSPVGFEQMDLVNDAQTDEIRSGATLHPNIIQVIGKNPGVSMTLLDPEDIDLSVGWQPYGAGETITSLQTFHRAAEQNGTWGGSYISRLSNSGVIFPVSLSGSPEQKATLQAIALAHFSAGTAFTVGSTAQAEVSGLNKAFYPTNVVIGADTITAIRDLQVNWSYTPEDDDQIEPAYYVYENFTLDGTATVKDVSKVSEARFEDGTEETVSVLFTDARAGGTTVSVSFGTCKVFGVINGGVASFRFQKLAD
jgi:hypothetical protein